MNGSQSPDHRPGTGRALRVEVAVRHPECWIIEVSSETKVGILGRGVYHTADRRANSHVTLFSEQQTALDEAVEVARASGHTFSVAEMTHDHEHEVPVTPGKPRRELLVEHDPTKQVSDALMSRGFVYGAPVDIRDGVEHWTLLTHNDRHAIQTALDEVRDLEAAKIELIGTKEKTDEYAYQWATVQLVGNAVPIVLDARPVRGVSHGRRSSKICLTLPRN